MPQPIGMSRCSGGLSVSFSLVTAMTILPAVSLKLSGSEVVADRLQHRWRQLADTIIRLTDTHTLRMFWVGGILGLSLLSTWAFMPKVDFLPRADVDAIESYLDLPPGTNLDMVEKEIFAVIEKRLEPYYKGEKQPAVRGYNVGVGPGWAVVFLYPAEPEGVEPMMELMREET